MIRKLTRQERILSWLIWKLDARLERVADDQWVKHQNTHAPLTSGLVLPVLQSEGWCGCCQPDCTRGCGVGHSVKV